MTERAVK